MSSVAVFIVESYQGSFIPVSAYVEHVSEIGDSYLSPQSHSMPFVLLTQAQAFLHEKAPASALVYDNPIKMNPIGIKWLSEVEAVQ